MLELDPGISKNTEKFDDLNLQNFNFYKVGKAVIPYQQGPYFFAFVMDLTIENLT